MWPGDSGPSVKKLLWWTGGPGNDEGNDDFQGWKHASQGIRSTVMSRYRVQYYYLNRLMTALRSTDKGEIMLTACESGNFVKVDEEIQSTYVKMVQEAQLVIL